MHSLDVKKRWDRIENEGFIDQVFQYARSRIPEIPESTRIIVDRQLTSSAGNAHYDFVVKLSYSVLGNIEGDFEHFKDELRQTLLHELAHIAEFAVYKRADHGMEWGYFMGILGAKLRQRHHHAVAPKIKRDRFLDHHGVPLRYGMKVLMTISGKACIARVIKINRTRYVVSSEFGDYTISMDDTTVIAEGSKLWEMAMKSQQ